MKPYKMQQSGKIHKMQIQSPLFLAKEIQSSLSQHINKMRMKFWLQIIPQYVHPLAQHCKYCRVQTHCIAFHKIYSKTGPLTKNYLQFHLGKFQIIHNAVMFIFYHHIELRIPGGRHWREIVKGRREMVRQMGSKNDTHFSSLPAWKFSIYVREEQRVPENRTLWLC